MVKTRTPDTAPETYSRFLEYVMDKNLPSTVLQRTVQILPRSLADPKNPTPGRLELVLLNRSPITAQELRAKAIGSKFAELAQKQQLVVDLEASRIAYQSIEGDMVDAGQNIHSYIALRCRLYRIEGWLGIVNYFLKTDESGEEEICQSSSGVPQIMPSVIWGVRATAGATFPGILNRYFPDRNNVSDWLPLLELSANAFMGATLIDPSDLRVLGHEVQD